MYTPLKGQTLLSWICSNLKYWLTFEWFYKKPVVQPKAQIEKYGVGNPLGLDLGKTLTINLPDYGDGYFTVAAVRGATRVLNDEEWKFTDYDVIRGSTKARIRYTPKEDADSEYKFTVLVLKLVDQMEYDKSFVKEVLTERDRDGTGKFVITDDNTHDITAEYWRPEGVNIPYRVTSTYLRDKNRDGILSPDEAVVSHYQMWDYSRETTLESAKIDEFLIVEVDDKTGWIEIWKGIEIIPERVITL